MASTTVYGHTEAWALATTIASTEPRYTGLELRPQFGLVPIGRCPQTGLLEFAHLRSGCPPQRDPITGELSTDADSALVLVLMPGDEVTDSEPCLAAKHPLTQTQWSRLARSTATAPRLQTVTEVLAHFGLRLPYESEWRHLRDRGQASSDINAAWEVCASRRAMRHGSVALPEVATIDFAAIKLRPMRSLQAH